jgi:DEAD/DEAH box helicase domain-containing protein
VIVANSSPLDQYLVTHPEYFLGTSVEQGMLNPDNLLILQAHLKCAVSEVPFGEDESFGENHPAALLRYFEEQGIVRHSGNRYYWSSESYPAEEIALRSSVPQNIIIHDRGNENRVLAEVDYLSA